MIVVVCNNNIKSAVLHADKMSRKKNSGVLGIAWHVHPKRLLQRCSGQGQEGKLIR